MVQLRAGVRWAIVALTTVGLGWALGACGAREPASSDETVSLVQARVVGPDSVPCAAWGNAVVANTGSVLLNAASLVDSYSSTAGAYGGSNVGSSAIVRAATTITNNGAVVRGQLVSSAPSGLALVPVPAGATNLPLGSSSPGSLNINTAGSSVTLAPGNYVAANISVNAPGAIKISPAGQVRIWVTGSLNLGGSENPNGSPHNLAFLVTSSGFVNVNSGGALYGAIYAPTSGINLNSSVFGSVIGGSISLLNSGAAVHYDTAAACPTPVITTTVSTPVQLPPPPDVRGCYVGTWNGWAPVPCSPYDQLPASIRQKPFIGGGQVVLPGGYLDGGVMSFGPIPGITSSSGLKFGQVETTFVDVATDSSGFAESNVPPPATPFPDCGGGPPTPNNLSIQANTNQFAATTGDASLKGDQAWVQFVVQDLGANVLPGQGPPTNNPGFNICIWNNDFTLGKADENFIPGAGNLPCSLNSPCEAGRTCSNGQCLAPTYWPDCLATSNYAVAVGSGGFHLAAQQRQLQTLDHATVAASAFVDAMDGQADLGMVATMSWFDPSNNNNDYHGLYAVVTKDRYGLGATNHWSTVTGTVLGLGDCGTATFPPGSMVYTSVQAGNCAIQGTPPSPSTVTWPGVCPNTLGISSSPAPSASMASITDESNNLSIIPSSLSALANATDGNNYLEMHYLASVDKQCVGTPRVYVKDHAQDHGSTPSNLGGEAFWESPDILIVEPGTTVTPDTPSTETTVIAGHTYALYVRLHNEYACGAIPGVRARLWWGNAALAVPMWTDIINNGPDPTNIHWSATKDLPQRDALDIIGPISWQAPTSNVSPHECLLANIQAMGEAAPTNTADTPNSNQVAQRNIEVGGACVWTLTNGTQQSQLNVTFTAKDGLSQSYVLQAGDAASVTFDDPNQTLFKSWSANAHPGCTLNPVNGKTVVTISTGFGQASVQGAPLTANQTLNVTSSVVPALFSGTTINLGIATYFSNNGTFSPSPTNGATCSGSAQNGGPH
jgi:hypothetical protein